MADPPARWDLAELIGQRVDAPVRVGEPVLILGGTGLLGRALCQGCLRRGLRPIAVSRHSPPAGVLPEEAIHLAADLRHRSFTWPGWPLAPTQPLGLVDLVATGPEELRPILSWTREFPGRLVALSSAAVFGNPALHAEEDPVAPTTAAMVQKVRLEQELARLHQAGRTALALRCSYPYGIGHGPLTPLGRDRGLFARLQHGELVRWAAPGLLAPLQPLWADDLAEVILELLCRPTRPRPLYHVAGPVTLTWDEYLEHLITAAAPAVPRIERLDFEQLVAAGGGPAGSARWLVQYLGQAPLLDDSRLRREVLACATRLETTAPRWARWCLSGAP